MIIILFCLHRSPDHQSNSLWEDTFWDNVNKGIPQLDGTDDIPDMPQRRRLGIRGHLFSKKAMHKPKINSSITTVVRSDACLGTVDSEKLCNIGTECKSIECSVSVSPEEGGTHVDQADDTEIKSDSKNPEIAADVETEDENGSIRNSLMAVSNESKCSVAVEGIEVSSEHVPIITNYLMMDTKSDNSPIGTIDIEDSAEISPVELDRLLLGTEGDSIDDESMQSVSQDCLSSENSLDALKVIREGSVHAVTSEVVGSECLNIALDDMLEISKDRTVPSAVEDVLVDPETNPCNHAFSKISEASESQGMKCKDTESCSLAQKGICSGFGPFHATDECSDSERNFKPVCFVCCNTNSSSRMSDGSVNDLHLNTSGSSFEVNGQYCEQFRQAVLIGDPSFTAQPSLSDADNELQGNTFFSNGNTSSVWLSSEQSSETSNSLYISDIGTDLLAEYDAQPVQEISLVKNPFSCRTSDHHNSPNKTQKSGRCSGLIQPRRIMTRNSEVEYTSNNETEKPHMKCSTGNKSLVKTEVTEHLANFHVHPTLSLDTDTEIKAISFPTVSEHPLDIFPVEVKRIESILWKGNMDEIIELTDSSVKDNVSSLKEVQNSGEILDSYVQKAWGTAKNRHRANANKNAVGKKCKEGIELPVGDIVERSAVTAQTQSVNGKLVCQNNNTLTEQSTLPALLPAVTVHNCKYMAQSNGIRSEKLTRRLQREKRTRLSLSYRRKTACQTSKESFT